MRNAIAILPVVSAIYPIITGATAPPTIVMISNEEASLVFVPASLNASENIVGNMMLSLPDIRRKTQRERRFRYILHNLKIIILVYCMEYVHGYAGNSRYVLHSGFLHSTSYLIQHQPSEQNNRRLPYSNLAKPQES